MTFRLHAVRLHRRTILAVNPFKPFEWKWAWAILATLLLLCGLARIEPETAEAVNSTICIGAIGCVLWCIWQLMQHDQ
jgi:hypothetical protein